VPDQPATTSTSFPDCYLAGALNRFYALPPGDTAAALELPRSVDRLRLCQTLARYAEARGAPEAVFKTLERLEAPESRAVLSGQQTGLLLGPTYTLAKAVTAVKLARRLDSEERPVVPIFWLASQDHDSAEIDSACVLDLAEQLHRIELPLPEGVPSGRIPLDAKWVEEICQQLGALSGPDGYRREVLALLKGAASKAASFADWFAAILYVLLGEEGLIIINPLEPDIAPLFAPVLAAEVRQPLLSSQAINEAGEALKSVHLHPQLGRAGGASNLFVEEDDAQRRLLHYGEGRFFTETRDYRSSDLLHLLETDPGRLTPAAGLRPVTQDAALPTAVTVVGPGELRYFAQLKGVYELRQIAMPLIWPRVHVTVLEPPVARIMEKYGLTLERLEQDFAGAREDVLLKLSGHAEAFDEGVDELERLSAELFEHVRDIDPSLERSVERRKAGFEAGIRRLRHKSAAALGRQDTLVSRQFERLAVQLFPEGVLQERLLSPFSFFLKFGVRNVMEKLLELPPEGRREVRF
jgi:bacillithiol biosynthesis cysteine-adding enzyme BshC